MFIVDELLNLDNQQRINYKNFMTKLKQIDDLRQNSSMEKKVNPKIHSDPFIYKGGVPEINCLSCDQNIPVLKIEQMLDDQSTARKLSPENSGRVFPKRGTNAKNKKMHYMMEESMANKKESAQKIFDNYMNFEKEHQLVDQLKRKSLVETGEQNLLSMTTGSAMFKKGMIGGKIMSTRKKNQSVFNAKETISKITKDSNSLRQGSSTARKIIYQNDPSVANDAATVTSQTVHEGKISDSPLNLDGMMTNFIKKETESPPSARHLAKSRSMSFLKNVENAQTGNTKLPMIKIT